MENVNTNQEATETQDNQVTEVQVQDPQAEIAALKAKLKKEKEAKKQKDWEAKYPHVVAGSTRLDEGVSSGKHSHGKVCTIRCEMCKAERTINVQDAFQVRYCEAHSKLAKKVRQQERRQEKKLEKLTPEALAAQIAELNKQLASMSGKTGEQIQAEVVTKLEAAGIDPVSGEMDVNEELAELEAKVNAA